MAQSNVVLICHVKNLGESAFAVAMPTSLVNRKSPMLSPNFNLHV